MIMMDAPRHFPQTNNSKKYLRDVKVCWFFMVWFGVMVVEKDNGGGKF